MKVSVRYFASLREALGSGETVDLPAGDAAPTVAQLRDRLIAQSEAHARVLARGRLVRSALDAQMCSEAAPLRDGAEVAFFPPVTGG